MSKITVDFKNMVGKIKPMYADNTCTEIPFEKKLVLKRNSVLLLTSK